MTTSGLSGLLVAPPQEGEKKLSFGEQLRILKQQKQERERLGAIEKKQQQDEEEMRLLEQRKRGTRGSSATIVMVPMPGEQMFAKFGLQTMSFAAQNIIGAIASKLGSTIDKKVHMSTLVSGKKVDPKAKFNRLGVSSKYLPEEIKSEQTVLMVQNLIQSKPMLYRRFVQAKTFKPAPAKSNPMASHTGRSQTDRSTPRTPKTPGGPQSAATP
jgi:hypothetical protein